MSRFTVDDSETEPGYSWACNACPFTTSSQREAVRHAIAAKQNSPFPHMLYERPSGDPRARPRRRVATYAGGAVQTETAPARVGRKRA